MTVLTLKPTKTSKSLKTYRCSAPGVESMLVEQTNHADAASAFRRERPEAVGRLIRVVELKPHLQKPKPLFFR